MKSSIARRRRSLRIALPDGFLVSVRGGGVDEPIADAERVPTARSHSARSAIWKTPKPRSGIFTPLFSVTWFTVVLSFLMANELRSDMAYLPTRAARWAG